MTDICTLTSVFATTVTCLGSPVCTPTDLLDAKVILCRPGPPPPCHSTIEEYSCKRDDGSTYRRLITIPPAARAQ